jgi:hypothetical protein
METMELKQSVTFKNILLATDFSEVSRKVVRTLRLSRADMVPRSISFM